MQGILQHLAINFEIRNKKIKIKMEKCQSNNFGFRIRFQLETDMTA